MGPPGQYAHGSGCGHGYGFVMTAITVTPEMVRLLFLRRTGRSFGLSSGDSEFIISAFESVRINLCFAAIWFFM